MTRLDNDLISRKALLEAIKQDSRFSHTQQSIDLITNAPTIEADNGEAVAWKYTTNKVHTWITEVKPPDDAYDEGSLIPLFTSPQKQWVELTSQQITNIAVQHQSLHQVAKAISAKLKEVNHVFQK
jgi:hypothetical protein